jgi:Asp-tRNA(Asn)/Glu-tRNA(Gln) amidotransferase A subunit family amidase
MTRTVADAALLMTVLSRPDRRDTTSLPPQELPWREGPAVLRGLRLGLLLDAGWGLPVEAQTEAAVRDAARRFEAAGAVVEPVTPFCTRAMADGMDDFWRMRSWLDFSALEPRRQALVLPYIRDWLSMAVHLDGAAVFRGFSQMAALRQASVAAMTGYDALLSPVSPVATFPAPWASPLDDPRRPFEHIAFTLPYNMSEQPAIAVPCGSTDDGRPIGLQIAGQRHDDLGVLRLAAAWESLRGPLPDWPTPPSADEGRGADSGGDAATVRA